MKETSYLSLVLSVTELSEGFGVYVRDAHHYLSEHFVNYEVVVVYNGGDASGFEALRPFVAEYLAPTIFLALPHRYSREIAGYVGLEYAKGDFVLEIEHTLATFPSEAITRAFEEAGRGSDIVSIVPRRKPSIFSALFYHVLKRTSHVPLNLETEHARIVTRRALNALFEYKQRTKYRKLLYAYTGYRRTTVEYDPTDNVGGHEETTFSRLSLALDVLIGYTTVMVRATLMLALTFLLISLLGAVYAIVIYFVKDVRVEGWTTLMLFVSFGLSGIFLILALVVKYLEAILHESQSAPLYVVRSVHIISRNEVLPHV